MAIFAVAASFVKLTGFRLLGIAHQHRGELIAAGFGAEQEVTTQRVARRRSEPPLASSPRFNRLGYIRDRPRRRFNRSVRDQWGVARCAASGRTTAG